MKSPHERAATLADDIERTVLEAVQEYRDEILHAVEDVKPHDNWHDVYRGGYRRAQSDIIEAIKRVKVQP